MNSNPLTLDRRKFIKMAALGAATAALPVGLQAAAPSKPNPKFCVFEKPLTFLNHDDMADLIAETGFDGIEAAVRPGGRVEPEKVEEELPKLVDALKKRGLEITILTSGINRVDQPHTEKVLRTAQKLGIKRYRMLWYQYDVGKPIMPQVDALRPVIKDLAQLNREIGISGLYQNHSGPKMFGASVWDIYMIIQGLDPRDLGLAYDTRHSQVEAGACWPTQFNLVKSHIGAVCAKDFTWTNAGAPGAPLGQGRVDKKIMGLLAQSGFGGPFSLHVEYLKGNAGRDECVKAFRQDFQTLKTWVREAFQV